MKTSYWILIWFLFQSPLARGYVWNGANLPSKVDLLQDFEYDLNRLPVSGFLKQVPWSENYWPSNMGSINQRWNTPDRDGFDYLPYSKEELKKLTLSEMMKLSPSEKYDIYMGRYDYPLFHEVERYGNPNAPDWYGICDGWSIAAIQFPEPIAVQRVNPDGIVVPFGSSDVKALLSYSAAIHFRSEPRQVGLKCNWWSIGSACSDINAGSLHVILANLIGIKKKALITEIYTGYQIWNQPTYGFEFQIIGSAEPTDGDHGVLVKGSLYYTDELENSSWDPVVGTSAFKFGKLDLKYILDLDENNRIIGGTWVRGSMRPDFVWIPTRQLEFSGLMTGVPGIYRPNDLF